MSDTYTEEDLTEFKKKLADFLLERNNLYEESLRAYPAKGSADVDEFLKSRRTLNDINKRTVFVAEEVDRISKILLVCSKEYQTPTPPGL